MQIRNEDKVHLFDLAAWYFLPLLVANFLGLFLVNWVEQSWLPSEKESTGYLVAFYGVAVLRLILGLVIFFQYLEKGRPPFAIRVRPEALLVGLAFGSALTGFFFGLTMLSPGFALVPGQGWLFVWEVLLFRYLPLFMFYGAALQMLLHDKHGLWPHVAIAAVLQVLWAIAAQLWEWSQGGHVFDWQTLYPLTTVLLAIVLMKRFGLFAGVACLFVNALAYQTVLLFNKFPLPSHLNSVLTMLATAALMWLAQAQQLRAGLLQAIRSRSIAKGSALPTPD